MADPRPRLRVRQLSKGYGSVQALDSVEFELRASEVMALLGENGAGKSTLVKVLSGLVVPDGGTIEIDGRVVDLHPASRSQAAGVAVVHQEYSLVSALSIAENLMLGQEGTPAVWLPRQLHARARALLDQVGLTQLDPGVPVERLAVAEMQLVEIARVLARDARILIFDEPTAALADKEIARVLDVIRALAAQGRSVIYVTHRLPEVFALSDRVTVFRNGRSLPPRPTRELTVDGVITLMLGRELETMYPPHGNVGTTPLLTVTDLRAPGLEAPLSFSLRPGEILGLTGQLGSGASVVVQALSGMLPPDGGIVTLDGRPLSVMSRAATLREGVAYCSADRKLDGIFAGRPIRENLSSPWLDRVSSQGVIALGTELRRAHDVATRFAVDARRLSSAVGTLSGGNQQKVAVGKWLGIEPRLMLLEEPTRGVDVGARAEIYRHLRDLCATGLGIVVASSDTAEILGLSDTIATFYRGRMTALRPQRDWTEDSLLREVMHQEAA